MAKMRFCPKCGYFNSDIICTQCGTNMIESDYTEQDYMKIVMSGKSQHEKWVKDQRRIYVINSDEFDKNLYNKTLENEQKELEDDLQFVTREEMDTPTNPENNPFKNLPKCPTCGSTNIQKIGGVERGVSVLTLGFLSKKINKSFKCLDCKYTW